MRLNFTQQKYITQTTQMLESTDRNKQKAQSEKYDMTPASTRTIPTGHFPPGNHHSYTQSSNDDRLNFFTISHISQNIYQ